MKKLNVILSIISLVVTSFVMIVILYAWYVTNQTVSAKGISGSVIEKTELVEEVKVYQFSSVTTSEGTSTYTITNPIDPETEEPKKFKYNPDFNSSPTARLFEIVYKSPAVNIDYFKIESNAGGFPGYNNSSKKWYIESATGISLSGVVKFKFFYENEVTFSEGHTIASGTVQFTTPTYSKFAYNESTGIITTSSIECITSQATNIHKLYVLIDFDTESFEKLYSNNIGNSVVDEDLEYDTDFKFKFTGSVVSA